MHKPADHAAEVTEYLRRRPGYWARYGTLVVTLFLLCLIALSFTTPYPTSVTGTFTLQPPASDTPLSPGNSLIVQRLLVSDGQLVEAGQTLLVGRDSRLRYDQVLYLEDQLLTAAALPTERLAQLSMPLSLELGPLQQSLLTFTTRQSQYLASAGDRAATEGLLAAFGELQKAVTEWKRTNTVVSPVAGRVTLADSLRVGELVGTGQIVAVVEAAGGDSRRLRGRFSVPVERSGRLVEGQRVLLDVRDWPALQYGALVGEVTRVKEGVSGGMVEGSFELSSHGLVTDTGVRLTTQGVLSGEITVVVGEGRLADRVFW